MTHSPPSALPSSPPPSPRIWLVHGWSYSAALWDATVSALNARCRRRAITLDCDRVDFGYWHDEYRPEGRPDLVVGHSFGSLWALCDPRLVTVPVLAVNGFTCFAASPDVPTGVPPRGLARMIRGLETDPESVLTGFRQQIGDLSPLPNIPPDLGRLRRDLVRLQTDSTLPRSAPVLALAGSSDPLITPLHSRACFGDPVPLVADGGHLLPLTHPDAVAEAILASIGQGESEGTARS